MSLVRRIYTSISANLLPIKNSIVENLLYRHPQIRLGWLYLLIPWWWCMIGFKPFNIFKSTIRTGTELTQIRTGTELTQILSFAKYLFAY